MLEIKNLKKRFGDIEVLKGIDLSINEGDIVAIIGKSGTGKSTLLRCINFLETPNSGTITLDGIYMDVANADDKKIRDIRDKTAMVFQNYCLFKNKTVLENIMIPLTIVHKIPKKEALKIAIDLLEKIGLVDKKDQYPSRLSGGQQQRIGIARALACNPKMILLDEPTSSLDPELIGEVLNLIRDIAREKQSTMLIVTHEIGFALEIANRIVFMEDGIVVDDVSVNEIKNKECSSRLLQFISRYAIK